VFEVAVGVRKAERSDAPTLVKLVEALADYEKLDPPTEDAQTRLIKDGWPDSGPARFSAWLAETDDAANGRPTAIGYAVTFFTYSSFLARPTLYIEDIFILPDQRRSGAGTALFEALKSEAEQTGCGRMEWVVLDWNTTAQQFYQKLGAQHLEDWQYYRLSLNNGSNASPT
jgi:GNAT superfamily N-acetyltransferase